MTIVRKGIEELDMDNRLAKIYLRNLDEALKIFVDDHDNGGDYKADSKGLAVAEKRVVYKKVRK